MNERLPLIDVMAITKHLCDDIVEKEHATVHQLLRLNEEGNLKEYVVVGVCIKEEKEEIEKQIKENEGKTLEEVVLPERFCHITTFDADIKKREITFDNEDNWPIKEEFNDGYKSLVYFFKKFISFRNNLIETKQVVKDDDIYQYYLSLTGGFQRSRKRKK